MAQSIVILFHFLNIAIGFTALALFSRRMNPVSPAIQESFIQQALLYNILIILTAVTDFLYYFFWKVVSHNDVALNFLLLLNLSNLGISILWCASIIILFYAFLEKPLEPGLKSLLKYSGVVIILLLLYCYFSSFFNLTPNFFPTFSLISSYSILFIVLGYSVFLYKKLELLDNSDRKNALKMFSILFIVFWLCSIFVYLNAYPLHLFSRRVSKFLFSFLDLFFNAFIFFWAFKYFHLLGVNKGQLNLENVSEEELISKFQISKRELEVIHLICSGKSNQEIADLLFISVGTVKNHLYNIYAKVGIKNRTQLAKLF